MAKMWILVLAFVAVGCGAEATNDPQPATGGQTSVAADGPTTTAAPQAAGDGCAHVIDARMSRSGDAWTVSATVSSADTGWDKFADAWQVWGPDQEILAERVLAHPHETEQPFTRSQSGVVIPAGIDQVTVAARDSVLGFCGEVFVLEVPQS